MRPIASKPNAPNPTHPTSALSLRHTVWSGGCDTAFKCRNNGGHQMKMLLTVEFPPEPFNSLVRSGTVGGIIRNILETIKPETAYFTEQDGKRGGFFIVDLKNPSDVPFFAEPFFLKSQATCKFRILMSPADLQSAGLDDLGKKWA
jgi:hypothetical protein